MYTASQDCTVQDCTGTVQYSTVQYSTVQYTVDTVSHRWGGGGLLYTASQDRTIKVWRAQDGVLCRTLQVGHCCNTVLL